MLNLFYVTYFLGFFMVLFTGYLIYTYSKAFNDVKVKTRNYLSFMRKIEKGWFMDLIAIILAILAAYSVIKLFKLLD